MLERLPAATKIDPKETLEWEKELVGVYVSSHPLQQMTVDLMNVVTHATVDITEELAGRPVTIAGLVNEAKTITTKKGETMAFVRLEDLQGTVDVTVFPQLYRERKSLWVADKIVIVMGKVDVRNGRVSVVADIVQDYVEGMKVVEDTSSIAYRYRNGAPDGRPQVREQPAGVRSQAPARYPASTPYPEDETYPASFGDDANPFALEEPVWMEEREEPARRRDEGAGRQGNGETGKQGDKETRKQGNEETGKRGDEGMGTVLAARPIVGAETPPAAPAPAKPVLPAGPAAAVVRETSAAVYQATGSQSAPAAAAPTAPPSAYPLPSAAPLPPTLKLTFKRTANLENDRKRLHDLLDLLGRYPGDDPFEIVVSVNNGPRYQLDFPNNRTRICRELQGELSQRLGAGAWRIER
jgi:hypothetical protein